MKGFQPGRKKTGGKIKGEISKAHLTTGFKDRLQFHGFNFDRAFARCLKLLCDNQPAPQYSELRALLPYAYPKLKEIDSPEPEVPGPKSNPMTDAELLEAMKNDGKPEEPKQSSPSTNTTSALAAGSIDLQAETDSEGIVPGMVGEQEPQ